MNEAIELKAKMFCGMSEPSRLAILQVLVGGPKSVTEIVEETGLSQPNVSAHLDCLLHKCRLVTKKRNGRNIYYKIADSRVKKLLEETDKILDKLFANEGVKK